MNLYEYLKLTNSDYEKILDLIRYSRDIASGQTKYKNYLIELKEYLNSNYKVFTGTCTICSIDELNAYFGKEFADWQGLENEISNATRIPNDYKHVELSKSKLDSKILSEYVGYKSIKYEDYITHAKSISVSWKGDDGSLLNIMPIIRNSYTLTSNSFFNGEDAYFIYQNPTTEYNGIQNLKDIEELRICRCSIQNILPLEKQYSIEVYINEVFSLDDIINLPKLKFEYSDYWYQFLLTGKPSLDCFGDFIYASINVQSDIGANYLFKKENGLLYLLLIEEWGVGQPTFQYIVNYDIDDSEMRNKITNTQQCV